MTESRRNVRQDPEDPPPFPGLLPPVILSGVLARSGEDAGREGIWGGAAIALAGTPDIACDASV